MNKRIPFLFLVLLLLSSCVGTRTAQTKEQAALTDDAHRGVKGVTINFIKNNPPDIAFSGNPLDIVVEVKNEGAATVTGSNLFLSGYDPVIFKINPRFKTLDRLEGRTKFNTFGGYDTAEFKSENVFLPQGTDTLDQTFLASLCYVYRTEARIPVCIDPSPFSVLENEACRVTNPSVGGGQGGPVSVSAVREDPAPGQVGFYITVANQGDGIVVDQFSMRDCPSPLNFDDVDSVQYSVALSGKPGDCKPTGKLRLANKQGSLYCIFKLDSISATAFTTVLEINLDYGYLTQKTKAVKVKSLS